MLKGGGAQLQLQLGQTSEGHAGSETSEHVSEGHAGRVTSAQASDGHSVQLPAPFASTPAVRPETKLRPSEPSAAAASASSKPPQTMRGGAAANEHTECREKLEYRCPRTTCQRKLERPSKNGALLG